jgi:hypothetical protein
MPFLQACVETAAAAGRWADAARLADGGAPGLRRAAHLPRARALLARGRLAEARAALACAAPAHPPAPQAPNVRDAWSRFAIWLRLTSARENYAMHSAHAPRANGCLGDAGAAYARASPLGRRAHRLHCHAGAQMALQRADDPRLGN